MECVARLRKAARLWIVLAAELFQGVDPDQCTGGKDVLHAAMRGNPIKGPKVKLFAGIVVPLLVVGAANAGDIVIKPKASDGAAVVRLSAGKILEASRVEAVNTGELAIKPKASDSVVVLTVSGGRLIKASIRPKPEHMAQPKTAKHTAVLAPAP